MSKVTVVSTVTYAVEVDVPTGFTVDKMELAAEQTRELKAAIRASVSKSARLLDVQASTVVVSGHPR